MKLRAKEQMHITSLQAETIRPGQEIEVTDARGQEILAALPGKFEHVNEPIAGNVEPAHARTVRRPRKTQ